MQMSLNFKSQIQYYSNRNVELIRMWRVFRRRHARSIQFNINFNFQYCICSAWHFIVVNKVFVCSNKSHKICLTFTIKKIASNASRTEQEKPVWPLCLPFTHTKTRNFRRTYINPLLHRIRARKTVAVAQASRKRILMENIFANCYHTPTTKFGRV